MAKHLSSNLPLRRHIDWLPFLMLAPALVLLGVLLLYPILRGVQMSFYDIDLLGQIGSEKFVGLDNYMTLLQSPDFWSSLRVTGIYTLGVTASSYIIGLITGLLLHRRYPGRAILRTLMVIPWAVPEVVAVLIFTWMFDAQYGSINFFLIKLGVITKPLAWLIQPSLALVVVCAVTIWKQFPVASVMLLAGLQSISEDLYEAASIDGANAWNRFRYITWPGLRPVNLVLILVLVLYSFRRVTIIYTMTAGGPVKATETLAIQSYLQGFKFFHMGYAATIGTVILAILLVFTIVYFSVLSRREEAG
jgi:multiple sugar transport system permease protein